MSHSNNSHIFNIENAEILSKLAKDYCQQDDFFAPLIQAFPSFENIEKQLNLKTFSIQQRELLVQALQQQYSQVSHPLVQQNIELLLQPNTYTITTAHQPNLFTGPLYFIYKIINAIKLAEACNKKFTNYQFVPVYYMGSEDADLEEIGQFTVQGYTRQWNTKQTGAVGRMIVDKALINVIDELHNQIAVMPYGSKLTSLLKKYFTIGTTIQQASFSLVSELFKNYGLLVLIPDNALLKQAFIAVAEKELLNQTSSKAVEETNTIIATKYTPQAQYRDINLFYLDKDKRQRIINHNGYFEVIDTDIKFTTQDIIKHLYQHPERFSPNVILRPVFQETILPNVVFIGGGGEVAYWLQLKKVFEAFNTQYPIVQLRHSFMLYNEAIAKKINKLPFKLTQYFTAKHLLIEALAKQNKEEALSLSTEINLINTQLQNIKLKANNIDHTLLEHSEAVSVLIHKKLKGTEKKMLQAAKKQWQQEAADIDKIKQIFLPNNTLQERVENFSYYYALYGEKFIDIIYNHCPELPSSFVFIQL